MTTAADLKPKPPKILLYGPPGGGKTALAMTLGADAIILDADDGLTTAVTLDDRLRPERLKVECKQFSEIDISARANVFKDFTRYINTLPGLIARKEFKWKALIIDSLTSFGEAGLKYIMGNSGAINAAPEINHWGLIVNELQNVMAVIKSLPIVVVLIAHDEERSFGKLGSPEQKELTSIAVPTKKLISRIPRFYDEIWYTKTRSLGGKKQEYYLHTRKDDAVVARSRLNLADGTVYATIDGNKSTSCVGLWEILKSVGFDKETMNAVV